MSEKNRFASSLGMLSVALWSFMPLLTLILSNVPVFQILSLSLGTAFLMSICWLSYKGRWHIILKQKWYAWLLGILGIFINDACYIWAFKTAPAAQVEVINYLWPLLILLFEAILFKRQIKKHHITGFSLAFVSVIILLFFSGDQVGFNQIHMFGYGLALMAAITWALYVVLKKRFKEIPTDMIGMYCGIGALLAYFFHIKYETSVIPDLTELSTIIVVGITTSGGAYFLWDFGIKFGNLKVLSFASYFIPIFSISILTIAGKVYMNQALPFSALLLLISTIICSDKIQLKLFN